MKNAKAIQRVQVVGVSDEERALVDALAAAQVLTDPKKRHFKTKLDVALVGCPDGTRMRSFLKMLLMMYEPKCRQSVKFHPLLRHGGGMVLNPESLIVNHGSTLASDLLDEMRDAVGMGYKAIILSTHLPCRKARNNGISPLAVIGSLAKAKARIKEEIPGITVVCVLQVNSEELYFFSKTKFEAWLKEHKLK